MVSLHEQDLAWWESLKESLRQVISKHLPGKNDAIQQHTIKKLENLADFSENEAKLCQQVIGKESR